MGRQLRGMEEKEREEVIRLRTPARDFHHHTMMSHRDEDPH